REEIRSAAAEEQFIRGRLRAAATQRFEKIAARQRGVQQADRRTVGAVAPPQAQINSVARVAPAPPPQVKAELGAIAEPSPGVTAATEPAPVPRDADEVALASSAAEEQAEKLSRPGAPPAKPTTEIN
ncbi:MAG: hypothetical protein M3Z64_09650, partial [Verrucomicrobiota bacterium]|nr:hypothetical protein [Verrucomicrobiota bacterium]